MNFWSLKNYKIGFIKIIQICVVTASFDFKIKHFQKIEVIQKNEVCRSWFSSHPPELEVGSQWVGDSEGTAKPRDSLNLSQYIGWIDVPGLYALFCVPISVLFSRFHQRWCYVSTFGNASWSVFTFSTRTMKISSSCFSHVFVEGSAKPHERPAKPPRQKSSSKMSYSCFSWAVFMTAGRPGVGDTLRKQFRRDLFAMSGAKNCKSCRSRQELSNE